MLRRISPLIGAVVGVILLVFSSLVWYFRLASILTYILYGGQSSFGAGFGLLFFLLPVAVCSGAVAGARLVAILISRRDNLLSRGITPSYLFSIVAAISTAIIGGLMVVVIYAELVLFEKLIRESFAYSSISFFLVVGNVLFSSFTGGSVSAILGVRIAALSSRLYR